MTEINPILKNTSAYKIAENLDKQDGTADGKISASVWNEFVKDKGGKEVNEFINIEDAMKSITTYAIRGAKVAKTTANELGDKWFKATPESGEADAADGAGGADGADNKKNVPVNKGNADKDKAAAAKEQGLRPTYNSKFYYSETEKEHYKWNPKTKKFTKYPNIAYFNKDKTYVRKYKNKDGSAKVIDYSADGYPTKMQARNWQNKPYLNKDFVVKKLGLQETYATKSNGIYYDKATKMHYKWNEKTHAFDVYGSNKTTFVDKAGYKYKGKVRAKITTSKNGARKEVITASSGKIFENTYDTKGHLKTEIEKDKDGKVETQYNYTYDNNKMTKKIETNYQNGKKSSVYHTDANGNKIYEECYYDDFKYKSINYEYDSNGNKIKSTDKYFDENGKIKEIYDYYLDYNGYATKIVNKDSSGNTKSIDYITRRTDGWIIAQKTTDPSGNITETKEWVYDTDDNLKEFIHKDGKGNVIKD